MLDWLETLTPDQIEALLRAEEEAAAEAVAD